jgi:hypothetical protein
MPTQVRAKDGDSLCVIAMRNGFLNCDPLRREPKNAAFLKRPLRDGDIVTVPDVDAQHAIRPTDAQHKFTLKNAPPVSIRYVHGSSNNGSSNPSSRNDAETMVLNVSNYPTDVGGVFGNTTFPNGFGFNADGHADPDAFKVEVVDPAAGGGTVAVNIEALMPVYKLEDGQLKLTGHQQQSGNPTAMMECAALGAGGGTFLSKYLRVVTHDEDASAAVGQTVQVVSPADGNGTGKAADPDNVEILDFEIRATYTIRRCTAPKKCTAWVSRPVGDEAEQQRFRIAYHIFIKKSTGAPIGGLTVKKVRQNALFNLRGYYAQASMAPRLVSADGSQGGSAVVFMPEPDNNMIAIDDRGASGKNHQRKPSTLTISDAGSTIATVNLTKWNPREVANAIKSALDQTTFKAEIFKNPKKTADEKYNPHDVLVTRRDGSAVDLSVVTDDTSLQRNITVVRVDIANIDPRNSPELRRVFRSSPGPAGAINVYAIDFILNPDAENPFSTVLAFSRPLPYDLFTPESDARQVADSILCVAQYLDENTPLPGVMPHECGHILGHVGHAAEKDPHVSTELMNAYQSKPTEDQPNRTRISDYPILVNYELTDDATRLINAVNRFTTSRKDLLEQW